MEDGGEEKGHQVDESSEIERRPSEKTKKYAVNVFHGGKAIFPASSWATADELLEMVRGDDEHGEKIKGEAETALYFLGRPLPRSLRLKDLRLGDDDVLSVGSVPRVQDGEVVLHPLGPIEGWPSDLRRLLEECRDGMTEDAAPHAAEDGEGCTYFLMESFATMPRLMRRLNKRRKIACFKPRCEEPYAPCNPRRRGVLGQGGMRSGLLAGEGWQREVAASLLDYDNFARVPSTRAVVARHAVFENHEPVEGDLESLCPSLSKLLGQSPPLKVGSFQAFVTRREGDCFGDWGPSKFDVEDIQRIALLDLRIRNRDRHAENIIALEDRHAGEGGKRFTLIPIDHGLSLPASLESHTEELAWFGLEAVRQPLCASVLEYVREKVDAFRDLALLRCSLQLRPACEAFFLVTNIVLRKCLVDYGMTLHETACVLYRQTHEEPSPVEIAYERARRLAVTKVASSLPRTPKDTPYAPLVRNVSAAAGLGSLRSAGHVEEEEEEGDDFMVVAKQGSGKLQRTTTEFGTGGGVLPQKIKDEEFGTGGAIAQKIGFGDGSEQVVNHPKTIEEEKDELGGESSTKLESEEGVLRGLSSLKLPRGVSPAVATVGNATPPFVGGPSLTPGFSDDTAGSGLVRLGESCALASDVHAFARVSNVAEQTARAAVGSASSLPHHVPCRLLVRGGMTVRHVLGVGGHDLDERAVVAVGSAVTRDPTRLGDSSVRGAVCAVSVCVVWEDRTTVGVACPGGESPQRFFGSAGEVLHAIRETALAVLVAAASELELSALDSLVTDLDPATKEHIVNRVRARTAFHTDAPVTSGLHRTITDAVPTPPHSSPLPALHTALGLQIYMSDPPKDLSSSEASTPKSKDLTPKSKDLTPKKTDPPFPPPATKKDLLLSSPIRRSLISSAHPPNLESLCATATPRMPRNDTHSGDLCITSYGPVHLDDSVALASTHSEDPTSTDEQHVLRAARILGGRAGAVLQQEAGLLLLTPSSLPPLTTKSHTAQSTSPLTRSATYSAGLFENARLQIPIDPIQQHSPPSSASPSLLRIAQGASYDPRILQKPFQSTFLECLDTQLELVIRRMRATDKF